LPSKQLAFGVREYRKGCPSIAENPGAVEMAIREPAAGRLANFYSRPHRRIAVIVFVVAVLVGAADCGTSTLNAWDFQRSTGG